MSEHMDTAHPCEPHADVGDLSIGPPERLGDLWRLGPAEVICAVGAGGKTALLNRLAREYEVQGHRVILTTTTRVWPPWPQDRPLVCVRTLDEAVSALERDPGVSPFLGQGIDEAGKLIGIPPEWVTTLRDLPWVGAVLVEADGSKGLPLKAPASWEPVIPECASVVVALAGLDAQGVSLDAEHVHRPELLADVAGLPLGRPVPPEALLRALLLCYAPVTPPRARLLVVLNKADVSPPATELLDACASSSVETWAGALVGGATPVAWRRLDRAGMSRGPAGPDVLVLAAGFSRRMGIDKLLARMGDGTVVGRVVQAVGECAGLGRVVVVTGPDAAPIERTLRAEQPAGGYTFALNPDPSRGMGSSLSTGVLGLYGDGGAESVAPVARAGPGAGTTVIARHDPRDLLVLLGDQPLVTGETIGRILAARGANPRAAAVGLARAGGVGPPVLLHRSLLPLLAELSGDQGARGLLARFAASVVSVAAVAHEDLDVDTPADLKEAQRIVRAEVPPGG